jgi:DHA2 family multidrug resistance protein-like MFS transporter
MVIGSCLMIAATLLLSFAGAEAAELLLGAAFALLGAGQAFSLIGISSAALASVPPGKAGAASGIRSTASYAGGALWVALAGAILTVLERSSLSDATAELGRRLTTGELQDADGLLSGSQSAEAAVDGLSPLDADAVRDAAADAFAYGMSWALRLCAIALAVVTVLAVALYRRGAPEGAQAAPAPEHSPHPHPPLWGTLARRHAAAEERS